MNFAKPAISPTNGSAADASMLRQFRSTMLVSSLRLAGKSLGLVKILVIASIFGASGSLDAFWIAYTIPAMLPGVILGVVATAFIPRFMHSSAAGEDAMDWRGLNTLLTLVGTFVILLAILVAYANHGIVRFMAPGLPPDVHESAARLTALMSIAVLLFGANAMLTTLLQAMQRFTLLSLESVVSNIFIIAACLFAWEFGIDALVIGVISGFAFHFILLAWGNRDLIARRLRPAFAFGHSDFRAPARHMTPLLIGYLGATGIAIVDRMFLSTLDSGAISILTYAVMLAALPMEVFGQAVLTVFYPALSQEYTRGSPASLMNMHVRGLRLLLFVLVPVSIILIVAADPLVTLLLQHGQFGLEETAMTASVLVALAISIPATGIKYLNFRLLHARQEPWTAVFIGLFCVCLNALLDYLLIGPYGVAGVAYATSISLIVAAILSSWIVRRRLGESIMRQLAVPVGILLLISAAMVGTALLLGSLLDIYMVGTTRPWLHAFWDLAAFLPGLLVFLALGLWLKLDEARRLVDSLNMSRLVQKFRAETPRRDNK